VFRGVFVFWSATCPRRASLCRRRPTTPARWRRSGP